MSGFGSAGHYVLWGLGGIAQVVAVVGLVVGLRSSRRAVSFRFALAGLAAVLALGLLAWWSYRQGLVLTGKGVEVARGFARGEVEMRGIHLAQQSLTLGLALGILPLLASLGLLARGLMLAPADGAAAGRWRAVAAVVCLAGGAGLMGAALLDYLNLGPFLRALVLWIA